MIVYDVFQCVYVCVSVGGCVACLLTGVGAVVFGPVQTSILAHLEIEALPAEQPGHYALQLWFYTPQNTDKRQREEELKKQADPQIRACRTL